MSERHARQTGDVCSGGRCLRQKRSDSRRTSKSLAKVPSTNGGRIWSFAQAVHRYSTRHPQAKGRVVLTLLFPVFFWWTTNDRHILDKTALFSNTGYRSARVRSTFAYLLELMAANARRERRPANNVGCRSIETAAPSG
jgi:hypothetical protein